jgi:hypothetical protein
MEGIVHICNGDSTADSLSMADLPGDIRVWAVALDRGPTPAAAVGSDDEWVRVRSEFWAGRGYGSAAESAKRLADWDRGVDEAAAKAEEVILWFEHDLFDQLALARLLARMHRRGLPATLTIVSIDRHPEVPNFLGLGQLEPTQLAELWPRRTPLSRDALDEAVTAWIAVTSSDPRALPFLTRRVKALPFLGGALERLLEEYPDPTSGMSRTERQVLAAIARGEGSAAELMKSSHASDPRYPMTDMVLFDVLRELGRCGFIEGAPAAGIPTADKMKALAPTATATGRQALAGAIDRVQEQGIDEWRCGVHLKGRGPAWRWSSSDRKLVER